MATGIHRKWDQNGWGFTEPDPGGGPKAAQIQAGQQGGEGVGGWGRETFPEEEPCEEVCSCVSHARGEGTSLTQTKGDRGRRRGQMWP